MIFFKDITYFRAFLQTYICIAQYETYISVLLRMHFCVLVYIYMCVHCTRIFVHVCLYVCMFVGSYVCAHACVLVRLCVRDQVCMYVYL